MVRKIILCDHPKADFAVYLVPDKSSFYYQYTELALGYFIDKLPQACYIQVSDKCHMLLQ